MIERHVRHRKDRRRKKQKQDLLVLLCFFTYALYLGWRMAYTVPYNYGIVSMIAGILLLLAEVVGFWGTIIFYILVWKDSTIVTPMVDNKKFPDVDVFIATYNEPVDLLYKTIICCLNMDYPDKSKVHIYVCDDGNRQDMAAICQSLGVGYITRNHNTHAKAGNLNNALRKTNSPYIVTFDADMIPRHNFLMKTIPFFMQEEEPSGFIPRALVRLQRSKQVGFVQVPQNFYNPDLFQYNLFSEANIPNEQDFFFRVIQSGKGRFNAVIYAGSNTVIARAALISIGGFITGTITEDFATGMKIQSKGYKSIYLNEILASGLSPITLADLYNQRIRWGRGVVQTFKAYNPWCQPGLSIMQKIIYFDALLYWYFGIWRLIFIASPILFALFNVIVINASTFSLLVIWLPSYLITNYTFKQFSQNIRSVSWTNIYDTILFPHILMGVIAETIGWKQNIFKVTPKKGVPSKTYINSYRLVWPQYILICVSLAGIAKLIYLSLMGNFQDSYIINLFWLLYNLYLLIMAVLFSSERPKFRKSERMLINIEVLIHVGPKVFKWNTYDISEEGLSVITDCIEYINPNHTYKIEVKTNRYKCNFLAELIHVTNYDQTCKYAFHITDIDEAAYRQLLLILYDRIPQLSQKINDGNNPYKNIIKNIENRQRKNIPMQRKYPRFLINKFLTAYTEDKLVRIYMRDFNFKFCTIDFSEQQMPYSQIIISVGLSRLHCIVEKKLLTTGTNTLVLYRIDNYLDIVNNPEIVKQLKSNPEPAKAAAEETNLIFDGVH